MIYKLAEQECEVTDEFEGLDGWVCVSSGDIYFEDKPFGYYVASWFPNLAYDLKIMTSVVNENLESVLTIGAVCSVGRLNNLKAVDPNILPWGEDGVMYTGFVKPEEYDSFTRAHQAFDAMKFVIENDQNISNYLCKNA
jgi:hypothetical protein